MRQEDKEILRKYAEDEATIEEQARAESILSSDNVIGLKECVKYQWESELEAQTEIDKDLGSILDKVHHHIHLKENDKKVGLSRKLYNWYSAAAAIVLIPLLLAGVISIVKLHESGDFLSENLSSVFIEAPQGAKIAFKMPDGSDVVLNGGSSLEYAVPFSNIRNVKLNGEAYFAVSRDEKHPFVVSTNKIEVKVLGTKFNVCTYTEDDITEVVLEEGKVECSIGKSEVIMQPNEKIRLVGNRYSKTNVNASKYTAWREGKLIFRGDLMDEVARRISRWYNVDVEVKGEELNKYSFRAVFQDDPIEEVLRLLKLSSPIDYEIKDRVKQTDGSFSKKKIIISKKN